MFQEKYKPQGNFIAVELDNLIFNLGKHVFSPGMLLFVCLLLF